jgi:DNA polymerase I-like protein with 3'-5' exonuclease and polymerase domains
MQAFPEELPDWCWLEHQVAQILTTQEEYGWHFDEKSAWELEQDLRGELERTTAVLRNRHPYVADTRFTPKRNNQTKGYIEGTGKTEEHLHCGQKTIIEECSFTKLKELNVTSRDHIAWILTTHDGWTPLSISSNGKPVIDEKVLKDHGSDIAMKFLRCLELKKLLGILCEGVNAWLKLVTTSSRIHHHCSVATNTFRCAHRRPNISQTPSDFRFRALFTATDGFVMCGADLSGIELRMLAHYLARHDGGRYADILLNGDIHQVNADKIGISRRQVKTVSYAFLYGAGDQKLGLSVDPELKPAKAKEKGKEIRAAYVEAIDGLGDLLKSMERTYHKRRSCPYVKAIDGRKILVDSPHKALNYLLQGSAGIIAKRQMVIANENLPPTAHQLGFIHDELQYEVHKHHSRELAFTLELSAALAGEYYSLRCPIEAEAKIGKTWADVH